MAVLRTVSTDAKVAHSVPTVGEYINHKNARGVYRIIAAGCWTTIALCGVETEKGVQVELNNGETRACKKCLKIIEKLYG